MKRGERCSCWRCGGVPARRRGRLRHGLMMAMQVGDQPEGGGGIPVGDVVEVVIIMMMLLMMAVVMVTVMTVMMVMMTMKMVVVMVMATMHMKMNMMMVMHIS